MYERSDVRPNGCRRSTPLLDGVRARAASRHFEHQSVVMRAAGHAGDAGAFKKSLRKEIGGDSELERANLQLLQARSRRMPSEGLTASTTRPTCGGSCMRSGADATPCASVSPSPAARRRAARRSGGCSTHSTSSSTGCSAPAQLRPGSGEGESPPRPSVSGGSLALFAAAGPDSPLGRFPLPAPDQKTQGQDSGASKDVEKPCVPPKGK